MSWSDAMEPVRMRRVAVLLPADRLREVLVAMAGLGTVELDIAPDAALADDEARSLVRNIHLDDVQPRLSMPARMGLFPSTFISMDYMTALL